YTATSIEDTAACTFPAELFRQILKETPELAFKYLADGMQELRNTQQRLLSGVEKDVQARVAEALIYLKANYPNHTFTRKEIAECAGTTTESVIRTLSDFADREVIEQIGRQITIRNAKHLRELAGLMV